MKNLTLYTMALFAALVFIAACDGNTTIQGIHPNQPDHCDYQQDCEPGYMCQANVCVPGPDIRVDCDTDQDCSQERYCLFGYCVPRSDGDLTDRDPDMIDTDDADETVVDGDETDAADGDVEEMLPDGDNTDDSVPIVCLPGNVTCMDGVLATCNEGGTNWFTEECPAGKICVEDTCVDKICEPLSMGSCVDEYRIEMCNDLGTAWTVQPCGPNIRCSEDRCVAIECTAGEGYRCLGRDTLERCNPTGNDYEIVQCEGETLCDNAACREVICPPNELRCGGESGNIIQFCTSLGTQWLDATDCGDMNALCTDGACLPAICTPGTTACNDDGSAVEQCNDNGTRWEVSHQCDIGQGEECRIGECMDLCAIAAYDRSYLGCEFWGVDLDNGGDDDESQSAQYAIVVSNTHPTRSANVTIRNSTSVIASGVVSPLDLRSFLIADNHINNTGRGTIGYKITSDIPVSAYQFNPFTNQLVYSNDATLLLPTHALGRDYYMLSLPHLVIEDCDCLVWICDHSRDNLRQYIAIIATQPGNTVVNLGYSGATLSGSSSITLAQHEVYQVATPDGAWCKDDCSGFSTSYRDGCWKGTLDGSHITSDKPIAVLGGHQCNFIPENQWACDHLEHQLFPVETWGKNSVASATSKRGSELDWYRIVASENNTRISFNPSIVGSTVTLNAGQVHAYTTTANHTITADKPIMVGQYLSGQNSTGLGINAEAGDPAFYLVAPNEQFRKDYVILIPSTYAHDFVNVVAPPDTTITIDNGAYVYNSNSGFATIGDWRVKILNNIDDGTHKIVGGKPIGVDVYGYSQYVSYAYTGGLDLRLINIKE